MGENLWGSRSGERGALIELDKQSEGLGPCHLPATGLLARPGIGLLFAKKPETLEKERGAAGKAPGKEPGLLGPLPAQRRVGCVRSLVGQAFGGKGN